MLPLPAQMAAPVILGGSVTLGRFPVRNNFTRFPATSSISPATFGAGGTRGFGNELSGAVFERTSEQTTARCAAPLGLTGCPHVPTVRAARRRRAGGRVVLAAGRAGQPA